VLPAARAGQIRSRSLRRWISRGAVRDLRSDQEILNRVLEALGEPPVTEGLAALRLWGQTGERPHVWIAAADPVYLEPMLDHLQVHALGANELPLAHLRAIFAALQQHLGDHSHFSFARIGRCGYLRGSERIATANVSSDLADGRRPHELLPQGPAAADHDRLQSEVQMSLHAHEINAERIATGMRPINSLWFWGNGVAPEMRQHALCTLFGDDPLFKGMWLSCSAEVRPWPDNFDQCLDGHNGFVAVLPPAAAHDDDLLERTLHGLKRLLQRKRISRLSLIFRDRIDAELTAMDRFAFWRGTSQLLEMPT